MSAGSGVPRPLDDLLGRWGRWISHNEPYASTLRLAAISCKIDKIGLKSTGPSGVGFKFSSGHMRLVQYECLVWSSSTYGKVIGKMAQTTRRSMLKGAALSALGSLSTFSLPALAGAVETNSSPFQRPKLKITDVRTAQVIVHGPQTHIRIYTDQGIYGQGESTDAAIGTSSLIHSWRRMLIGTRSAQCRSDLGADSHPGNFAGAQGGQYITALVGSGNCVVGPCGKALELPVYQLMGGKVPR